MDRIEQLRKFVEARPDDPFPRYALALEFRSRGDASKAADELAALTARHPSYVPAYLILGQLYEQKGQIDQAKATYAQGQTEARTQGNRHALSELTSSLEQLGAA
jgi:DNA-binding SARP family transcriptional activator